MLCTAIVQPYGKRQLLNCLELFSLTSLWLTLWAGNVFNANPRCEDGKGGTVAWCDTISIAVGVIVVITLVAVVATMVYYKKQKQCDACLGAKSHRELEEEEEGMESTDVISHTNPTLDPVTAKNTQHINLEIEMTTTTTTNHPSSVAKKVSIKKENELPDGWKAYKTGDGTIYYEEKSSGVTQWNHPSKKHHRITSTKMPHGWEKQNDDLGRKYYSNATTQESSWGPPKGSTGGSAGNTKNNEQRTKNYKKQ